MTAARVLSIQGEELLRQAEQAPLFASPEVVDNYVDTHSPEVLACRESIRHVFPPLAEMAGMPLEFIDVTDDNLLVRVPIDCGRCKLAYREELWDTITVGRGRNARHEYVFVAAVTRYKRGPNGEEYGAPPGEGRIAPRAIKNSLATKMMQGQSPAATRKKAKQRAAEHAAEQRRVAQRRAAESLAAQHSA
jgi:hypothetical protein